MVSDTEEELREVAAFSAACPRVSASREAPSEALVVAKVAPSSPRITVALRALARSSGMREVA